MTAILTEYLKSLTLAPAGSAYKSLTKGNRTIRLFEENISSRSVFVHIPKTGGHSVAVALYGVDPWHFRYRDYLRHIEREGRDRADFTFFAVVRDPAARLHSMYRYLRGLEYTHRTLVPLKTAPDFTTFVKRYADLSAPGAKGRAMHPFLYSQLAYLTGPSGKNEMDVTLRFETLEADFNAFRGQIGKPDTKLPHLNKSAPAAPAGQVGAKPSISPEDRALVRALMPDEHEMLGYTDTPA